MTTTTAGHDITITEVQLLPSGQPLRASCLCGWISPIVPSRPHATAAGQEHVERALRSVETCASSARYLDDGAASIAAVGSAPSTLSTPSPDELEYKRDAADPYIDECPAWCEAPDGVHGFESCDEDRYHFGEIVRVPIRALTAEHFTYVDTGGYVLGHVEVYLQHNALRADPHLHLDVNGTGVGVDVTLDEAEKIARALLTMVEAAR